MVPDFRYLVERLRGHVAGQDDHRPLQSHHSSWNPGYDWLADFLVAHRLKIVASMPCYQPENVNAQRGAGSSMPVFGRSSC